MPRETTNHDFYIPDENQDGWGDDKEGDWEDLDAILANIDGQGNVSAEHIKAALVAQSILNDDGEVTADVDAEVGGFRELSVTHNGTSAYTEQVVFKTEDTDNTTPLSFDTGSLGNTYERLLLRGHVGGWGDGSFGNVKIRVNNETSSYNYNYIEQGTTGQTSSDAWETQMWNQAHTTTDFDIFGASPVADGARGPAIVGTSLGHSGARALQNGYHNADLPVDSVQLSTAFNAVGRFVIIGVDY